MSLCHSNDSINSWQCIWTGHIQCYMASAGRAVWLIVPHIYKLVHHWLSSLSNFMFACMVCTWPCPYNTLLWCNARKFLPLMPALCSMLVPTYYQNYAGIIRAPLWRSCRLHVLLIQPAWKRQPTSIYHGCQCTLYSISQFHCCGVWECLLCLSGRSHEPYGSHVVVLGQSVSLSVCRNDFSLLTEN